MFAKHCPKLNLKSDGFDQSLNFLCILFTFNLNCPDSWTHHLGVSKNREPKMEGL